MTGHRTLAYVPVALLGVGLVAACGVKEKTMAVPGTVMNVVQITGGVDPQNSCTPPAPPVPMPMSWFNSLPVAQQSLAVVGFQIWRNTADGGACQEHKDIAYRGLFQYDLSNVAPLKTVTKASITFLTKIMPPDVTPDASNLCSANSGGLGSLWEVTPIVSFAPGLMILAPTYTPPSTTLTAAAFPAGQKYVAFTVPWVGGQIGTNASTMASGTGGASFTVDVTGRVQAALTAGAPVIQFMLSGTDEAFPRTTPPPASIDCRTQVEVQDMTVTYVGS